MPGHKRRMNEVCTELPYRIDITEIDGFDNLHHAEGILCEAQERAARLWGAKRSFFLVNGSTCGILSAVSAVAMSDSVFIMARNCHKSVYHGIYVNGMEVRYLYPDEAEPGLGFAGGISPMSVRDALEQCEAEQRKVAAVIITSPTYEGMVSDIAAIAEIVHAKGIPLLVDEAHGAHFGFAEGYPDTALHQGADAVIQSVHKTLPALTQTALLHLADGVRLDEKRVERFLTIYQTSSPSYVLMSSIDLCMDVLGREGRERLAARLEDLEHFKRSMAGLQRIRLFYPSDPLKIVISVCGSEMTGKQIYDILLKEYHLQLEMAAGSYSLAMFSMMDTEEGYVRLARALKEIDERLCMRYGCCVQTQDMEGLKAIPSVIAGAKACTRLKQRAVLEQVCSIREAYDADAEWVALEKGVGRVAAEFVSLYPPGIPLVTPGERIDKPLVDKIRNSLSQGLQVIGLRVDGLQEEKIAVIVS